MKKTNVYWFGVFLIILIGASLSMLSLLTLMGAWISLLLFTLVFTLESSSKKPILFILFGALAMFVGNMIVLLIVSKIPNIFSSIEIIQIDKNFFWFSPILLIGVSSFLYWIKKQIRIKVKEDENRELKIEGEKNGHK